MNFRLQLLLWSGAALVCLVAGESDAGNAKKTAKAVQRTANQIQFSQIMTDLHQAKILLDHANHNYNGHRAKADHHIGKAIHVLHHEHHVHNTKGMKKAEPQNLSDSQLRQAQKLVQASIISLNSNPSEKAQHANRLLQEAVREIELAIHVHHKHHKNQIALQN